METMVSCTADEARKLSNEKNKQLENILKAEIDKLIYEAINHRQYEAIYPCSSLSKALKRIIENIYKPRGFKVEFEVIGEKPKDLHMICFISW